jgi:hypothetical protein
MITDPNHEDDDHFTCVPLRRTPRIVDWHLPRLSGSPPAMPTLLREANPEVSASFAHVAQLQRLR